MARRSDPRFDDMHHAPIFKKVKKDNFKTTLDDRFKTVLTDDRFNTSSLGKGVDKYGKKKSASRKKAANDLKSFYNVDDKTRDGEDKVESRLDYLSKLSRGEISGDSDSDSDDSSNSDSSSSDDTSSDESDGEDGYSSRKGSALNIPGDEVATTSKRRTKQHSSSDVLPALPVDDAQSDTYEDEEDVQSSYRLAIQNCDWENMSAEDIMAILQSFCSTMSLEAGSVKSVTVYPSDYGLERMEAENKYGPPKEIWNTSVRGDHSDEESGGEHSHGSGETSDANDEEGDEDEEANIMIIQNNNQERLLKKGISVNEKVRKSKEFDRKPSNTGLVFNLDNADSDNEDLKEQSAHRSQQKPATAKDENINTLALREYELSKLRYYFAIAVFDNSSVAEKIYAELDGIEFEHSSMALDLRFVPNDVNFEGREVRDRYVGALSATYAPPEGFVVDALQKTNVECSWDNDDGRRGVRAGLQFTTGDDDDIMMLPKGGNKKNTTASAWRRLQQSDMSQYMASESSSDEEDSGDGKDVENREKVSNLRKLLLGENEEELSDDDFFMSAEDENGGSDINSSDDNDMEEGETDKVMTFMPSNSLSDDENSGVPKKKSRKQKKADKQKQQEDWDVPQETLKRLRESKKSEKKKTKRSRNVADDEDNNEKRDKDLELLFAGDEDSDQEGRDRLNFTKKELAVAEELKQSDRRGVTKKKRKLSKSKAKLLAETVTDFKIDIADKRFSKVLDGDADYGIDRLSNDYRSTPGMEMILNERNNRKIAADKYSGQTTVVDDAMKSRDPAIDSNGVSAYKLTKLASKLKQNFNSK